MDGSFGLAGAAIDRGDPREEDGLGGGGVVGVGVDVDVDLASLALNRIADECRDMERGGQQRTAATPSECDAARAVIDIVAAVDDAREAPASAQTIMALECECECECES